MSKQPSGLNSANVTVVSEVERSYSMSKENEELHRAFDLLFKAISKLEVGGWQAGFEAGFFSTLSGQRNSKARGTSSPRKTPIFAFQRKS